MLFDRRAFLLSSAALAGCATSRDASAETDAALRALLDLDAPPVPRWQALSAFDASRLSAQGRILYEAIAPGAAAHAALDQLGYGATPYAVTHRNGAYRSPFLSAEAIDDETLALQADAARGVIAPDFIIDAALPLIEAAAAQATPQAAEALQRQLSALRALRARANSEASVGRLPDGEAYYRNALQMQLGAQVDPLAAHAQARARCAALHAEADVLMRGQGFSNGDVAARLRALYADPALAFPATNEGRAAAVAYMRDVSARTPALIASAFSAPPPPAEIVPLPVAEEAGGTRGRREDGAYIIDLGGTRPRWTLASVVYHETIPGHLLQAPFDANTPALQRRYAGGYSEGWATYAEILADEFGGFAHDPLARLGYLHWMLFRMARIVGDTGLHALGWSRARTVEEMRAIQGESIAFVSIEEDVTRMAAQPGAAAVQGLAALNILELRASVAARRGFTLPAFHDAVLRHGPMAPGGLAQAVSVALAAR